MPGKDPARKRRSTYLRPYLEEDEAKREEDRAGSDEGGGGREATKGPKKRAGSVHTLEGDLSSPSSLVAGSSSPPFVHASKGERASRSLVVDETLAITPGAVAVRGPGYGGGDDDSADFGDGDAPPTAARVPRREREGGGDNGATCDDALLRVESYAVAAGPTDDEIRQRILAGT
jgi:hypothetical protein